MEFQFLAKHARSESAHLAALGVPRPHGPLSRFFYYAALKLFLHCDIHVDALDGAAHLASVEERKGHGVTSRQIQIRVSKHHLGGVGAEVV